MYLDEDLQPWLVLQLGEVAADEYTGVSTPLLLDVFPNLKYGPNGDELVVLFDAIDEILDADNQDYSRQTVRALDFLRSLADTFFYFQPAAATSHRNYFKVNGTTAPYIDRMVEGYMTHPAGRRPMVQLRLYDLLPHAPHDLPDQHVRMFNVMANTVLLQHWYGPHVRDLPEVYKLVQQHNAFCARWNLPSLSLLPEIKGRL